MTFLRRRAIPAPATDEESHQQAMHAEKVLQRRSTVSDWVLITFAALVVMAWGSQWRSQQATNKRVDHARERSDATNSAVIAALKAETESSDATSRIAADFAALVAARDDGSRQEALKQLAADRASVDRARTAADKALTEAEAANAPPGRAQTLGPTRTTAAVSSTTVKPAPSPTTTSTAIVTTTTAGRAPPPASTSTTASPPTSTPVTIAPTTTTTAPAVLIVVPLINVPVTFPCLVRLPKLLC